MMNEYDPPNRPGFLMQNVTVQNLPRMEDYQPLPYHRIPQSPALNWCQFMWPEISAEGEKFSTPRPPPTSDFRPELILPRPFGSRARPEQAGNNPKRHCADQMVAGPSGLQRGKQAVTSNFPEYREEFPEQNVVVIDDSDDDVIYVNSEVELEVNRTQDGAHGESCGLTAAAEPQLRRNPSRKARNSRYGHDDNIYEKDFDLLDSSSTESVSSENETTSQPSTSSEEKPENLSVLNLKPWPVDGLHERPEYNSVENKIEKHDYTIRNIQNNAKKVKIEEPKKPKPTKKITPKKYIPRRRNPKRKRGADVNIKVSVQECKAIVDENYDLLDVFLKNVNAAKNLVMHEYQEQNANSDDARHDENGVENFKDLVRNQCRLFSLINGVRIQEAMEKFTTFLS